MANYTYSITSDLTNGLDILCLHKTIENYGFSAPFEGLLSEGDDITAIFTGSLSQSDQDDLTTLVQAHNPDNCEEISSVGVVVGGVGSVESLSIVSTNSKTPVRKLRMSVTGIPEGVYRIGWYYEWSQSSRNTDFRARVQVDDTTDLMYHSEEVNEPGTEQSIPQCGFAYQSLTEGNHDIDLDFWAESSTSYIKNVRLEIWRSN